MGDLRPLIRRVPSWCWFLVLALWTPLIVKGVRNLISDDGNDFTILLAASKDLLAGRSPYAEGRAYMYPPFFAGLLVPLVPLGNLMAGSLWLLLKIPLFYLSAQVLVGRGALGEDLRLRLVVLSPLLVYRSLESDVVEGNTNVLLLAGVAGAVYGVRSAWRCGGCVALVSAIKLSPLYLAAILAMCGRMRAAVSAVVLTVVLLGVSSLWVEGGPREAWRGFVGNSWSVVSPGAGTIEGDVRDSPSGGYLPGQSLRPLLHRYLRPIDATAHGGGVHRTIHVADVPVATVETIYRALACLGAILGLAAAWRRGVSWSLAWGALVLLLISPYSRKGHFLLMLPALLMLVETLLVSRVDGPRRWLILGALGISLSLSQLTTPFLCGKELSRLIMGCGAMGLAAMAILPAMWIIRTHDAVR